jgi:hypothetical protein
MTEQESEKEPERRETGDSPRLGDAPEWWLEEHKPEGERHPFGEGRHRDD